MDDVLKRIERLHEHVSALREYVQALTSERERLQQRVKALETALEQRENDLYAMKEEMAAGPNWSNGAESEQLKQTIDTYLKEIDDCLKRIGTPSNHD